MTLMSKNTNNDGVAPTEADENPTASIYSTLIKPLLSGLYIVGFLNVLFKASVEAYNIRLYAIKEYGRVIHEFDPYFNYRAAEVGLFRGKSRNQEDAYSILTTSLLFSSTTMPAAFLFATKVFVGEWCIKIF